MIIPGSHGDYEYQVSVLSGWREIAVWSSRHNVACNISCRNGAQDAKEQLRDQRVPPDIIDHIFTQHADVIVDKEMQVGG